MKTHGVKTQPGFEMIWSEKTESEKTGSEKTGFAKIGCDTHGWKTQGLNDLHEMFLRNCNKQKLFELRLYFDRRHFLCN